MEAAEPIQIETPKPNIDNIKIDFIEELKVNKGNEEYKIQFGIKENDLAIKVVNYNSENIYYYQSCYNVLELQNISMAFSFYKTIKDIITFLKNLKYQIDEKNNDLSLKFNIFTPDGKSQIIELNLKKCLPDTNHLIKYLLEEIKTIKINMKLSEENNKIERMNKESEIKTLKENNLKYQNEISYLKEENKKLWEEINQIKKISKSPKKLDNLNYLDSKIFDSINSIDFIIDYIRQNDKSSNFKNIQLLYRGSRDGDRTKTCHQLCDNKQNILIVMKSDTGYIFGGYSKIGFKVNNKCAYKVDNNSFLFSLNLKKVYPVIKDKEVICHIREEYGLCFDSSLTFRDNFMNNKNNEIFFSIQSMFNGFVDKFEMNGGEREFKCKELEVFKLI